MKCAAAPLPCAMKSKWDWIITEVAAQLREALKNYAARLPEVHARALTYSETEAYRHFLLYVQERLVRAARKPEAENAYTGPEEFIVDLQLLRESLAQNAGER